MAATDLFLKLDRPAVSVEEFTTAAQAMLGVVREIAQNVAQNGATLRWIITELRSGSALLQAEPEIVDGSPCRVRRCVRRRPPGHLIPY